MHFVFVELSCIFRSFEAAVKAATNGTGVDVVLNSLSGEFQVASLRCLAPCGRFLEIGKKDICDPRATLQQNLLLQNQAPPPKPFRDN